MSVVFTRARLVHMMWTSRGTSHPLMMLQLPQIAFSQLRLLVPTALRVKETQHVPLPVSLTCFKLTGCRPLADLRSHTERDCGRRRSPPRYPRQRSALLEHLADITPDSPLCYHGNHHLATAAWQRLCPQGAEWHGKTWIRRSMTV